MPPPRNSRGARSFSVDSFGPSTSPVVHFRRANRHPNARDARAFLSGSPLETRYIPAHFGAVHSDKTIASRAGFSHAAPSPTREGLSRDWGMAPSQKRARPPRIFGRFIWAHRLPQCHITGELAAIQMHAMLARFSVGLPWKHATPPRILEQFIQTKRSPRERASRTQPLHQPGRACLETEVWPPPRNARGPRAFLGGSFGPIDFPSGELQAG